MVDVVVEVEVAVEGTVLLDDVGTDVLVFEVTVVFIGVAFAGLLPPDDDCSVVFSSACL